MQTYTEAAAYLGRKTERPLPGRATRIYRRSDDQIAIRYQQTDVITYTAGGLIVLRTDGWYSVTTKARITEYTRAHVWATKGRWQIAARDGAPATFIDGMTITEDGAPLAPVFPTKKDAAKRRAFDRIVRQYIAGYAAHVAAGQLTPPGAGDCWGCCMQAVPAQDAPAGDGWRRARTTPHGRTEPMGIDHYLQHFEESYYVPSLLANAIKAKGHSNPGFVWHAITARSDGKWAAQILRGYFKNLKPALYDEWNGAQ